MVCSVSQKKKEEKNKKGIRRRLLFLKYIYFMIQGEKRKENSGFLVSTRCDM